MPALGKKIPATYFQHFHGIITGKKGTTIGIKITKALAISKVERDSCAYQLLQYGDIVTHIDDKKMESRNELEKLLTEKCKNDYSFKVTGLRLTTKVDMQQSRFPKGYEQNLNYKYHIAILYLIAGCKLALSVKSYNNKVFVTRVLENTLAAMSLSVGDAILDVESTPVSTVADASNAIGGGLQKSGYVTLVIEQANNPAATAQVRLALMAEKTLPMDLPLAPDVLDICRHEHKRFKRHPDLQPKQSILKTSGYKPRASSSRILVSEQTEDVPIACEDNPALLMKVPAAPPRPSQGQYFSIAEAQQQQQQQQH